MRKLANILFLLALLAQSAFAGNFFNISSSGTAAEININLCLNAKGPLTCQTYDVHALDLIISTTAPNHTYPFAGIKINTPGYQPTNCTPLENGYCMFAVNNSTGAAINIQSANNNTPPSTPANIMVTPSDNEVTVSWSASSGTQPIRYTVSASPFAAPPPECVNTLNTSCVYTNLTNGVSYTFTVTAANAAGESPESTPSSPVTPASPPGPPTSVTAVGGPSQAVISWNAPASDGGSPIIGYSVTSSPEVTPPPECTNNEELGCTFTGLTNGQAYTFTVVAINAVGTGPASTPSNSVTPENTVPGAPTNVIGTPENTQVSLNWTAPNNDGGSPVTGYTVTSNPAVTTPAACTNVGTTSCIFNGLANGTSYTFTVEATNAVGTGLPSAASAPVLPLPALYYSRGASWLYSAGGAVNFSTNSEPEGATMQSIFADGLTLYEGNTNGNVFASNNNGGIWTATSAQPTGMSVNGVFFNGNTLYATSDTAISYSTDSGASWAATASTGALTNRMFVSGTTLYVISNGVIKYSTDNGASWLSTSTLPVGTASSLFVDGDTIYAGSTQGAVYTSTDSGVTWIPTSTAPYGTSVLVFDLAVSGNGIYVLPLGDLNIKASFNGGLSWQTITQTSGSINFALFVNANAIYAGTQTGNVAYSLNGGITWTTITQPDGTPVLSVLTSGTTLYATTSDGNVLISTNNGSTWSALTSPEAVPITSLFVGGTTLYTATQTGNVYTSTTNGASWNAVTQPDGGSSVNTISLYNNDWYVGTQAGNILVSTDNGSTWTPTVTAPEAGVPVNSVFVTSTTIYAGLENGNFRFSTNGGTSWTSGTAPGGGAIKSVTMKAGTLYVGMASGEVKTSIDNGSTWQASYANPDSNNQINSVYLSNFVL